MGGILGAFGEDIDKKVSLTSFMASISASSYKNIISGANGDAECISPSQVGSGGS